MGRPELTTEVSMGGLFVFLGCWRWGHYSVPDQQGNMSNFVNATICATIRHKRVSTIHAQRIVSWSVLIGQILAEIFGGIGGRLVVRLGFGGVVACAPR